MYIPGRLNVIADKLFRLGQTIQTEWFLLPEVSQSICSQWHQLQVDLFTTRFNNKLPQFVSPVQDPLAWAVDALGGSGSLCLPTGIAILGKVVEKLQDYLCSRIVLIISRVAQHVLVLGLCDHVQPDLIVAAQSAQSVDSAIQPDPPQESVKPEYHVWLLEPQLSRSMASLRLWQHKLRLLRESQRDQSMRQSRPFLQSGASAIRWISEHHL